MRRCRSAALPTTPGPARSTSWAGRSIRSASGSCCRARSRFVRERLAAPARRFLKAARIEAPQFIFHPGGAKGLDAVETALDLQKGTLRDEREGLPGHGNMSAPSVLFVLERALKRGLRGTAVLSALGPGFTASFLALEASHGGGRLAGRFSDCA